MNPLTLDEPLVCPYSPGAALVRLSQVLGALTAHPEIAQALPQGLTMRLTNARKELLEALEGGDARGVAEAFNYAQGQLRGVYECACRPGLWDDDAAPACFAAMGFPNPGDFELGAVDVSTVLASFSLHGRQVVTALAFREAVGAVAYRLHEIRTLRDETVEESVVQSPAPQFSRVRLPVGRHAFIIESRNPSGMVRSLPFEIEVPALAAK
jgi:hypothetical protein